ncbi:hypothetical protein HYU95_03880 [Candidatus Daviesbacteria bacterium]|nr:hypothetical protein [Candidatus Daviesbacteria bacterium]
MKEAAQQEYVPLPEAHTERVNVYLLIPEWIDPKNIGVNLRGIESLCRLSGLRSVVIAGSTGKETSKEIPAVVGFNQEGGAYAAKSQAEVAVPLHDGNFTYDSYQSFFPRCARWADAKVEINMAEMTQRIQRDTTVSVRDAGRWVRDLNGAIKDGLFTVGSKHLNQSMEKDEKIFFWGVSACLMGAIYAQTLDISLIVPSTLLALPLAGIAKHVTDYAHYLKARVEGVASEGYRWDIYPTTPYTRRMAFTTLAASTTLIKDISLNKA